MSWKFTIFESEGMSGTISWDDILGLTGTDVLIEYFENYVDVILNDRTARINNMFFTGKEIMADSNLIFHLIVQVFPSANPNIKDFPIIVKGQLTESELQELGIDVDY
jgi:ascorbate-specific PTS system EIIC-type component UlaA